MIQLSREPGQQSNTPTLSTLRTWNFSIDEVRFREQVQTVAGANSVNCLFYSDGWEFR